MSIIWVSLVVIESESWVNTAKLLTLSYLLLVTYSKLLNCLSLLHYTVREFIMHIFFFNQDHQLLEPPALILFKCPERSCGLDQSTTQPSSTKPSLSLC